jgi:hypothetical protein
MRKCVFFRVKNLRKHGRLPFRRRLMGGDMRRRPPFPAHWTRVLQVRWPIAGVCPVKRRVKTWLSRSYGLLIHHMIRSWLGCWGRRMVRDHSASIVLSFRLTWPGRLRRRLDRRPPSDAAYPHPLALYTQTG